MSEITQKSWNNGQGSNQQKEKRKRMFNIKIQFWKILIKWEHDPFKIMS